MDEDLRVWLIEVNTGPYMGPVLTANHPHFMLDFLDDCMKVTLDKHFLNENLTTGDIEHETRFELLYSAEHEINERSTLGLETEARW